MSLRDADAWDWLWMPSGGLAGFAAAILVVALALAIVPAMWPIPVSTRFASKRSAEAKPRSAVLRSALVWCGPLLVVIGLVILVVRPAAPVVLVLSSRSHATPMEGKAFQLTKLVSPEGFELVDMGPAVDRALAEWQRLWREGEPEQELLRHCIEFALTDLGAVEHSLPSIADASSATSRVRRDIVESIELGVLRMAAELRNVAGIIADVEPRATMEGATWSGREERLLHSNGSRYRSNFVHFERRRSAAGVTLLGVAERLSRRSGQWKCTLLLDVARTGDSCRATLRGRAGTRAAIELRDLRRGVSLHTVELEPNIRVDETYDLSVDAGPFYEIGTARLAQEWPELAVVVRRSDDAGRWNAACAAVTRQLQDPAWRSRLKLKVGFAPSRVSNGMVPSQRDAPMALVTERGIWICRASDVDNLPKLQSEEVDLFVRTTSPSSMFMADVVGGAQVGVLSWQGMQLRRLGSPKSLEFAYPVGDYEVAVRLRALEETLHSGVWARPGTRVVPMLCRVDLDGHSATFLALDPLAFDVGFVGEREGEGPMSGEKWWAVWSTLFEAAASLEAGPSWGQATRSANGLPPRYVVDGPLLDRIRAGATRRSSATLLLGLLLYSVVVAAPVAWRRIAS